MVDLLNRICRRLKALLTKLKLDFYYKPRRVHELPELQQDDSEADRARSLDMDSLSSARVFVLNSARIYTDCGDCVAAIDEQHRLISGASWQYVNREHGEARDNNIFRKGITSAPRQYNGTVFSLLTGGGGNDNYYHWLYDAIPRLHILETSGLAEGVDYFLVPALRRPFQGETLDCLGIDRRKVISSVDVRHIKAPRVIMTSHPRPLDSDINAQTPEWICDYLRGSFLRAQAQSPLSSNRIYISRTDTSRRRVLNEKEVVDALTGSGFEVVCLTEYSFRQQVAIFANARTIVAAHGAGLTNITFCSPGTAVIEIFNETFLGPAFGNISRLLGLDYHRLLTANTEPSAKDPNARDIVVDVSRVMELLSGERQILETYAARGMEHF